MQDLLNGRPGDGWLKGWVRLTASGPLLVFWPYGPALYAWINGYATGISHHQAYFQVPPFPILSPPSHPPLPILIPHPPRHTGV